MNALYLGFYYQLQKHSVQYVYRAHIALEHLVNVPDGKSLKSVYDPEQKTNWLQNYKGNRFPYAVPDWHWRIKA